MRFIYLLLVAFLPVISLAQETKDVFVQNPEEQYVERFSVLKSDTTVRHGSYRRMDYIGGAPKLLGHYKYGKKDGRWQEFSLWDVFLMALGNYTEDKRNGVWTFYSKLNVKEQLYDYTKKEVVFFANDPNATYTIINGKDTLKKVKPERPPLYIGGNVTLMTYIFKHLVYPELAYKKGIHGNVQVACLIDKNGHMSKVWIVKGVEKTLDAASLKIMRQLPNTWVPALYKGKPVASIYLHEIPFVLSE